MFLHSFQNIKALIQCLLPSPCWSPRFSVHALQPEWSFQNVSGSMMCVNHISGLHYP